MLQRYLFLFLNLLLLPIWGQDTIRIQLFDTDGLEILDGSAMVYPGQEKFFSDNQGQIQIPFRALDSIQVSAPYFISQTIKKPQAKAFTINLSPSMRSLEVVTIEADAERHIESTQMGQMELEVRELKLAPAFMGEVDVIKTIQLLPGVQSAGEGNSGLYVRGGGPDQNLLLLDGSTVYNASHLFGFFSVFNGDIIDRVSITKGNMPAEFGGRLSSVLEIDMKDPDMKAFHISGGLGLVSSKLAIETPIIKDRLSIMLSGRRTYIDAITRALINKNSPLYGSGYFFYDLNGKITWKVTDKDKITWSAYYGKDRFTFINSENDFNIQIPWGNAMSNIKHQHVFNSSLYLESQIGFTQYDFNFKGVQEVFSFQLFSGIRDYTASSKLKWNYSSKHQFTFGGNYTFHRFTPSTLSASSGDVDFNTGTPEILLAHDGALFVSHLWKPNPLFALDYGLRATYFQHTGPFTRYEVNSSGQILSETKYKKGANIYDAFNLEPRVSARYKLSENWSLKAAYSMVHQYLHLTALSTLSLPTDLWIPATEKAPAERAHQFSLGTFHQLFKNQYEASVEVYYKEMSNIVEYKDGASAQDNIKNNVDNLLTSGMGYAYGIEFYIKKKFGEIQGWIGYTLARSLRKFEDLNQGAVFPARYDRIHDLSLVLIYKINDRWTLSSSFVFGSGSTFTVAKRRYFYEGRILYEYGDRNGYRMPPYHRLDLSATYNFKPKVKKENAKIKRSLDHSLNLSIYNVYNRQNPYFIYFDNEGNLSEGTLQLSAVQVSLFPIIPSISYQFKF